ncbi:DUF1854 domain-containing protein [Paenibacillus eucommiae]|uniref:DUF1854 domain-containing protein n=1 Tax=Paenibacillus eucommiae TaxID=1355755 RepID=A0ABS4IST7_9BACL|nr:DUF1854 domain-containing protein [Paenibacillus eucommiae]MBP1990637.1 hypothetical protein [Paenibacillus eucommiae]
MSVNDPYEINVLSPDHVSFCRGAGGVFKGVIGSTAYEELVVCRAFPYTYLTKYISVRNLKGEELGVIVEQEQLDEESRSELEKELSMRYFAPQVTRVDSVKQKSEMWVWELQTNLGPTRLTMRNLHEHMLFPGDSRVILTDMNGKRCEIPNVRALDAHSRKQLKDII